jgi:hypothetical protein
MLAALWASLFNVSHPQPHVQCWPESERKAFSFSGAKPSSDSSKSKCHRKFAKISFISTSAKPFTEAWPYLNSWQASSLSGEVTLGRSGWLARSQRSGTKLSGNAKLFAKVKAASWVDVDNGLRGQCQPPWAFGRKDILTPPRTNTHGTHSSRGGAWRLVIPGLGVYMHIGSFRAVTRYGILAAAEIAISLSDWTWLSSFTICPKPLNSWQKDAKLHWSLQMLV